MLTSDSVMLASLAPIVFACSIAEALGGLHHIVTITGTPHYSELDWLGADIGEVRRILDAHPALFELLVDTSEPRSHILRLATADLFWQVWFHAMAIHLLLKEGLKAPMLVVQRALFEAIATLGYLHRHPHRAEEATILLAATYLRDMQYFAHQQGVIEERQILLGRMPQQQVEAAKQRLAKHPRTWSGRTVQQMAAESGVLGYDPLYRILSSHAHAGVIGHHVQVLRNEDGTAQINAGNDLREAEIDANANFARRALHESLKIVWAQFLPSVPVQFRSTDPSAWFNAAAT